MRANAQWRDAAALLPEERRSARSRGTATSASRSMLDPKDGGRSTRDSRARSHRFDRRVDRDYSARETDRRSLRWRPTGNARGHGLQRTERGTDARPLGGKRRRRRHWTTELGREQLENLPARFPTDDIRVRRPRPARFHCDCSSDRVGNALRMLGRSEIESILAEQGTIGVTCEFCNRSYSFVAADALALFASREPQ